MSSPLTVRELGARGSKVSVSDVGDAADLPGPAVAVLATVPQWWRARAEAVGLSGRWLDVTQAVAVAPPVLPCAESFDLAEIGTTGEALGRAYVSA